MKLRNSFLSILKYIIITLIIIFATLNLIEIIKLFEYPDLQSKRRSRVGGGGSRRKINENSLLKEHKKKFTISKGQSLTSSSSSFNNVKKQDNRVTQQLTKNDNSIDKNINSAIKRTYSCLPNPPELSHTNLPEWMQNYFQWHYETRCFYEDEHNDDIKYLIVVCLHSSGKCGGIADRLKPVPYYIHYANVTNRILLFHWERPCNIEEYLIPSQLNFTMPSWISTKGMPSRAQISGTADHFKHLKTYEDRRIITAKVQTWDAGRLYYDEFVGPPYFNEIFHHLFRSIFQPTPPLQTLIDTTMTSLNLTSNNYVAVHVRARYPTSEIKSKDKGGDLFHEYKDKVIDWSLNALHCAVKIYPNAPHIYFASDSNEAVNYIQYVSPYVTTTKASPQITSHNTTQQLLHLDLSNSTLYNPIDFYPAFVDLYLIGNAKCVSFGMGGFGRFGQIMSYNHSCTYNHRKHNARVNRCPKPSFLL